MLPLPPAGYSGTERVVTTLALELHDRGHQVTVFAAGDSQLPCEVVATIPRSLWPQGYRGNVANYIAMTVARAWEESGRFDLIHSHVETGGFLLARHCPTPVLTTLHGRLDGSGTAELIDLFPDVPLVAISQSQRRWSPGANWAATIRHGMRIEGVPFSRDPGDYLLVVGRVAPEKGIAEAIDVARRTGRKLVVAAKVHDVAEQELFERLIQPAIRDGIVEWQGEVTAAERNRLMAGALATLMLGAWPEPFGLVAIESMATGTPVIARRAGAMVETVQHGVTGYLVDDIGEAELAVSRAERLRRAPIRDHVRDRFSVDSMIDAYEAVYQSIANPKAAPMQALPIALASALSPELHGGRAPTYDRSTPARTSLSPPSASAISSDEAIPN
ncbi:MAG: glycosyltransferase family 4 protein [Candidatus Limnocylindria bacterium]